MKGPNMTDNTTNEDVIDITNEPVTASQEAPAAPEPDETPDDPRGNREAAKYRKQLRETESERDGLRAALTAARLAVLSTHKAASQIAPTALVEAFTDPNAMFNPDGTVNSDAITAHLQQLRADKPHMFAPARMIIPSEGNSPSSHDGSGWVGAFGPKNG